MNVRRKSGSPVVLAGVLAAGLALFAARPAVASPTYPELLQKHYKMDCAPPCTVCHRDRNGGLYTVDKPFGLTVYSLGLRGQSPNGLKEVERQLELTLPDSDGDHVPDVQELRDGTDPNSAANGSLCKEGPVYGCGAHVARGTGRNDLAAALAMLAGLVMLVGMRRRR